MDPSDFDALPLHARNLRLGYLLREARVAAGFTLAEVEDALGGEVRRSAVSAFERGIRPIPEDKLAHLCELYGITVADLLGRLRGDRRTDEGPGITIDLTSLDSASDDLLWLQHRVREIIGMRRNAPADTITLRRADLMAPGQGDLLEVLRERGIVVE